MKIPRVARGIIEQFPLGFVATVTAGQKPNLSPKGTFLILSDEVIAFAEIRSPRTMAALERNDSIAVNFIDIWKRKGVAINGHVDVVKRGDDAFGDLLPKWEAAFPSLVERINAVVLIQIDSLRMTTTPPYDDGATEDEMIALYKAKFSEIYP